ncbi:MAG: AraC family transcriptional regulator, partial [Flavobacterium sp.]
MHKVVQFNTISEYNTFNNNPTLHPLISVIDFSKANERSWEGEKSVKIYYGFYCIFLKDIKCGDLRYGCNYYDYQEGTLVFVAPGQVMEIETDG